MNFPLPASMDFKRSRSSPLYLGRGFSHVTGQVFGGNLKMFFRYLQFNDTLNEICDQGLTLIRFEYELMSAKSDQHNKENESFLVPPSVAPPSHVLRQPLSWLNKIRIGLEQSDAQYIQSPSDSSHTYLIHIDTLFPQTLHCHAISWSVLNMLDHFLLVLAEAKEKARLRPWRLKKSIEKTLIRSPLSSHASS